MVAVVAVVLLVVVGVVALVLVLLVLAMVLVMVIVLALVVVTTSDPCLVVGTGGVSACAKFGRLFVMCVSISMCCDVDVVYIYI